MPRDRGKTPGTPCEDRARNAVPDREEMRAVPARPLSELFGILANDGPPLTLEDMDCAIAEGANDD